MFVYISILLLVSLIASFDTVRMQEKEIRLGSQVQVRKIASPLAVFLICAIFIFFFAARWYVGTDFGAYYSIFFKDIASSYKALLNGRDYGFHLLTAFIGKNITTNYFLYNIVIGSLIYIPVVLTFRKYSNNFSLACAMYVMMCLYSWPFNGVRQSIATAIIFAAYPLLLEKKNIWKFAILAFIAFTFHSSALLVLPFVLLTLLKPWKKPFVLIAIGILIVAIFIPNIWNEIIAFLDNIGQTKMADDYSDIIKMRSGVNFFRILVRAIPVVFTFIYYDKFKEANPHIDIFINMCVMALIFTICGSQVTVLARFTVFFELAYPVILSEFGCIFDARSKKGTMVIIFCLYFLHMLVLLPRDSEVIPYKFIFNHSLTFN